MNRQWIFSAGCAGLILATGVLNTWGLNSALALAVAVVFLQALGKWLPE